MIVEQRTYDIATAKIPEYMSLYEAEGFQVQTRHLGKLLGYYSSEFGALNQVVHLWQYENFDDRAERRRALFADADWMSFFERITPLILRQQTTILNPAPFMIPQPATLLA